MRRLLVSVLLLGLAAPASADTIEQLLSEYRAEGAGEFSADAGEKIWFSSHNHAKKPQNRSCTTCHTRDLKASGEHVRTGKSIEPMAASLNPERYTDEKKIKKWFTRNCKWTLERECTAQEKGDLLVFLSSH